MSQIFIPESSGPSAVLIMWFSKDVNPGCERTKGQPGEAPAFQIYSSVPPDPLIIRTHHLRSRAQLPSLLTLWHEEPKVARWQTQLPVGTIAMALDGSVPSLGTKMSELIAQSCKDGKQHFPRECRPSPGHQPVPLYQGDYKRPLS